jgi:hypothetical protein
MGEMGLNKQMKLRNVSRNSDPLKGYFKRQSKCEKRQKQIQRIKYG